MQENNVFSIGQKTVFKLEEVQKIIPIIWFHHPTSFQSSGRAG